MLVCIPDRCSLNWECNKKRGRGGSVRDRSGRWRARKHSCNEGLKGGDGPPSLPSVNCKKCKCEKWARLDVDVVGIECNNNCNPKRVCYYRHDNNWPPPHAAAAASFCSCECKAAAAAAAGNDVGQQQR